MKTLIDTTLLLVQLDERGIEIWRNRRGWFHASAKAMKEADGKTPIPVCGPFPTAVAAGHDALSRLDKLEAA